MSNPATDLAYADIPFSPDRTKARDSLGRVYEYFLGKFAQAEGKLGGEFFTPRCIVRLLVEMLEPFDGRVYDPCCGSGGMFVQSEELVEAHGGNTRSISTLGRTFALLRQSRIANTQNTNISIMATCRATARNQVPLQIPQLLHVSTIKEL